MSFSAMEMTWRPMKAACGAYTTDTQRQVAAHHNRILYFYNETFCFIVNIINSIATKVFLIKSKQNLLNITSFYKR